MHLKCAASFLSDFRFNEPYNIVLSRKQTVLLLCRSQRKGPATPILDAILLAQADTLSADRIRFPPGWHVEERDAIHFLNVAGPAWASLDYHLNPWGSLDDGLFELTNDMCATCSHQATRSCGRLGHYRRCARVVHADSERFH